METREKIAWGIAVLSIGIMVSYFFVTKGKFDRYLLRLNDLKIEKAKLDQNVQKLLSENSKLVLTIAQINEGLDSANSVIADLKERPEPKPVEVVRWRRLPADCQRCMENNSLPVTVVDDKKWVETQVRDAFHPEDGASVRFLKNFDKDILNPIRGQLKTCEGTLKDCSKQLDEALNPIMDPDKPYSFITENGVFVGAGYIGNNNMGYNIQYSGRFVRVGSKDGLNANFGINLGGFSPIDGRDIDGYGVLGAEVKW